MELKDVLFFDTETTGVPDRKAKWNEDFNDYPHVVQLAWKIGEKAESHIIRPDGWEIPAETVEVHGITTEYAMEHGESFVFVIDRFIAFAEKAGLLCGHNIHFDTSIIKANILRELGWEYYDANNVESALYKGKRIDTMRPAIKWVDARMANGRIKFPNLSELYARCFPGESFPAHDALEDVNAVARCLPVLLENGFVELKVKEYPEEQTEPAKEPEKTTPVTCQRFENAVNCPNFTPISENDKLPIQQEKGPQIENSAEISAVNELLEQNEF